MNYGWSSNSHGFFCFFEIYPWNLLCYFNIKHSIICINIVFFFVQNVEQLGPCDFFPKKISNSTPWAQNCWWRTPRRCRGKTKGTPHQHILRSSVISCQKPSFHLSWVWDIIKGDSRDPQQWDPLMGSFPYYSHTTPIRIPKDMGMVWEAYHKGGPIVGGPWKIPLYNWWIAIYGPLCKLCDTLPKTLGQTAVMYSSDLWSVGVPLFWMKAPHESCQVKIIHLVKTWKITKYETNLTVPAELT